MLTAIRSGWHRRWSAVLVVAALVVLSPAGSAQARDDEPVLPAMQVVVLADESRSLSEADVRREREATRAIALSGLRPGSVFSVVGFGSSDHPGQKAARVICQPTVVRAGRSLDTLARCADGIRRRRPDQGPDTDHAAALRQALSFVRAGKPDRRVVFLLTDGKLDVRNSSAYGDTPAQRQAAAQGEVDRLLADLAKAGAQVWPLGFGQVDPSALNDFAAGRSCTPVTGDPVGRVVENSAEFVEAMGEAFSSAACVKYSAPPTGSIGGTAAVRATMFVEQGPSVAPGGSFTGVVGIDNWRNDSLALQLLVADPSPGAALTVEPSAISAAPGSSTATFAVRVGASSRAGLTSATLRLVDAANPSKALAELRFRVNVVASAPRSSAPGMTPAGKLAWYLVAAVLVVLLVVRWRRRSRALSVRGLAVRLYESGVPVSELEATGRPRREIRFVVRRDPTGPQLQRASAREPHAYEVRRAAPGVVVTSPDGTRRRLAVGRFWAIDRDLTAAIVANTPIGRELAGDDDPFRGTSVPLDPFGTATPAQAGPFGSPWHIDDAAGDDPLASRKDRVGETGPTFAPVSGSKHAGGGGTTSRPYGSDREDELLDLRRPGDRGEPPPVEPPCLLVGHLPSNARLGAEVSLTVRIVRSTEPSVGTKVSLMQALRVGPGGASVTVVVESGLGLIPLGAMQQQIEVPADGDSDPVRFEFRTSTAALGRARVTAWAGGTFLAELTFEISIADRSQETGTAPKTAQLPPLAPHEGEVTLQVRREDRRYSFQLLSASHLFDPVLVDSLAPGPDVATEAAIATLRRLAAGNSGYTPGNARRWLKNTGIALWNGLVPEAVRDQFWQLRSHVTSFTIATGTDSVPWELLYPKADSGDEGFLIEQFPVTRRVYNQGRADRISLGTPRFVVPAGGPGNGADEAIAIHRILGAGREPSIITELTPLLDLLEAKNPGLLHFACHNNYRSDAGGSSIAMPGGDFVPTFLETAKADKSLASSHPLVFINACRSAGETPHYTSMMGFAQHFLAAGAGAFVGTLWDVRSGSALAFAEEFYRRLAEGESLGSAAWQTRRAASTADDDPTWLAYTVYGDPQAKPVSS